MRVDLLVAAAAIACQPCGVFAHPMLTTLYSFHGGSEGGSPFSNIAMDRQGNIYGVTASGGTASAGVVYELSPPIPPSTAWTETVLWNFPPNPIDVGPRGGLVRDADGVLYGTTLAGGSSKCGTVFRLQHLQSGWKEETIYEFAASAEDGCQPSATLTLDGAGNIYGVTSYGGANNVGTAFKIVPRHHGRRAEESVIWSFTKDDGTYPESQLVFDAAGNLYGTSFMGGRRDAGTVWKLVPPAHGQHAWAIKVLKTFRPKECSYPDSGPLAFDGSGALYGTCPFGGPEGRGVVFKLTPPQGDAKAWTESTVSSAHHAPDPVPVSGVTFTKKGDLIGASTGYDTNVAEGHIYVLYPPTTGETEWTRKVLWKFDGADGAGPDLPLLISHGRKVFGTTVGGGSNGYGTVWELTP